MKKLDITAEVKSKTVVGDMDPGVMLLLSNKCPIYGSVEEDGDIYVEIDGHVVVTCLDDFRRAVLACAPGGGEPLHIRVCCELYNEDDEGDSLIVENDWTDSEHLFIKVGGNCYFYSGSEILSAICALEV
jgi:hypothetical protein